MSPLGSGSFPAGATGNPVNTRVRAALQPTPKLPVNTGFVDFLNYGEQITMSPGQVERLAKSGSGAPLPDLPGKAPISGGPLASGDVDPANRGIMRFLASLFGAHDYTDQTTYDEWDFNLGGATANDCLLTMLLDSDVIWRQRFWDLLITGMNLSADVNGNLAVEFPFVCGNMDFHEIPTQSVGSGSTLPVLKGFSEFNTLLPDDTTDKDIYIRIDDASGAPVSVDVSVKVGAAAAYSASQTILLGQYNRLFDEAGNRIGLYANQVQVYWDTTATLVDTDEFRINASMAAWTPTLNVDRPIAAINTAFILDGEEVSVEGGYSITAAWEQADVQQDVSGKLGGTVRRSGSLDVTVNLTREIIDMLIQRRILHSQNVSLVINAITDVEIAGASREYRAIFALPQLLVSGDLFSPEPGGLNTQESPVLTAGEPDSPLAYDGFSFGSHFHVVFENDIATL